MSIYQTSRINKFLNSLASCVLVSCWNESTIEGVIERNACQVSAHQSSFRTTLTSWVVVQCLLVTSHFCKWFSIKFECLKTLEIIFIGRLW